MTKSHTQMLLAVALLVIMYLWWKRKAVVTSTFTAGPVVNTATPESESTQGDQSTV